MANAGNLVPNSARTPSERRANAIKAGKRSGEVRRAKRDAREVAKMFLDCLASAENAKKVASLFPCFKAGDIDNRMLLLAKKFDNAMKGKSNDIDGIFELAGEGPVKQQQIDLTSSDGSMSPHTSPEQTALKFAEMMDKINAEQSQ